MRVCEGNEKRNKLNEENGDFPHLLDGGSFRLNEDKGCFLFFLFSRIFRIKIFFGRRNVQAKPNTGSIVKNFTNYTPHSSRLVGFF